MAKDEADRDEAHDPMDEIEPLPRVQELGWTLIPKPPAMPREVEIKKAAIGWSLRPWSPRAKKSMVTMSDVGLDARARGGKTPARRKKIPKLLQPDDES